VSFTYRAFVSYTSEDYAWAERLHHELESRQLKVFLDQKRLTPGIEWDNELQEAIESSQHLIVLVSALTRGSDWVPMEIGKFQAQVRDTFERRVIPVSLEGDFAPLNKYEYVSDIGQAGVYAGGAAAVTDALWKRVVDRLYTGLTSATATRHVPLLLVTTTRAALSKVPLDKALPLPPRTGESLRSLTVRLGFGTRRKLLDSCYGPGRDDWRPFGGNLSIGQILSKLNAEINAQLRAQNLPEFLWDSLDDFWGAEHAQAVARLKQEGGLVVLDPLALYDPAVKSMADYLIPQIRESDRTVLMVLPPFEMPPWASALRESLQGLATEVFDDYVNPPVFTGARRPRYVTNVSDELELKAWLLTGIGPRLGPAQEAHSRFTDVSG
jgi:hypothetical protein